MESPYSISRMLGTLNPPQDQARQRFGVRRSAPLLEPNDGRCERESHISTLLSSKAPHSGALQNLRNLSRFMESSDGACIPAAKERTDDPSMTPSSGRPGSAAWLRVGRPNSAGETPSL